jgi:sulfur-carrier protein
MTAGLPDSTGSETHVIVVRYWAAARAATGHTTETVPAPTTLQGLIDELVRRHPAAARVLAVCSILVGDQPVGTSDPSSVLLSPGSTVEFLPPFAGG